MKSPINGGEDRSKSDYENFIHTNKYPGTFERLTILKNEHEDINKKIESLETKLEKIFGNNFDVFNGYFVIKTEFQKIKAPEKEKSKAIDDDLKRKILYDKTKKMLKMMIKIDDNSNIIQKEKILNGCETNNNSPDRKNRKNRETQESSIKNDNSFSIYKKFVNNYTNSACSFLNKSSSDKIINSRNITSPLSTNYTTGNASNSNYSKFDQNINFNSIAETKEFPEMNSDERIYLKTDMNNFFTNTLTNDITLNSQRIFNNLTDRSRLFYNKNDNDKKFNIYQSYNKSSVFKKTSANSILKSRNITSNIVEEKSLLKSSIINPNPIRISNSNLLNNPSKLNLNKIKVTENLKKLKFLSKFSDTKKEKHIQYFQTKKPINLCYKNKFNDLNKPKYSPNIIHQSSNLPSPKFLNLNTSGFNLKNYLEKSTFVKNKKINILSSFSNKLHTTSDRNTDSINTIKK